MLAYWVVHYALRTLLQLFAGKCSQNEICLRINKLKKGLTSEPKLQHLSGSSDWYPQVSTVIILNNVNKVKYRGSIVKTVNIPLNPPEPCC